MSYYVAELIVLALNPCYITDCYITGAELREVLTKLASNTSFSDELIKLIKDRMDFRSKSMLELTRGARRSEDTDW